MGKHVLQFAGVLVTTLGEQAKEICIFDKLIQKVYKSQYQTESENLHSYRTQSRFWRKYRCFSQESWSFSVKKEDGNRKCMAWSQWGRTWGSQREDTSLFHALSFRGSLRSTGRGCRIKWRPPWVQQDPSNVGLLNSNWKIRKEGKTWSLTSTVDQLLSPWGKQPVSDHSPVGTPGRHCLPCWGASAEEGLWEHSLRTQF